MTKTCGECKHLNRELAFCHKCGARWIKETDGANCEYFEQKTPPTNGDKIRQKTNEQFAIDYANYNKTHNLYVARLCPLSKQLRTTMEEAIQANLAWLNAPAESEVEDELL